MKRVWDRKKEERERGERGKKGGGKEEKGLGMERMGGGTRKSTIEVLCSVSNTSDDNEIVNSKLFFSPPPSSTIRFCPPLVGENLTPYCDFDVFASVNVRTQLKRILKRDKKKILRCFSSEFSSNEFSFNIETRERSIREG